jgi:transcriptional regulator with XRE-family HTH domain
MDLIASEQIRAARALLRMTAQELSLASGVGLATIKRLEAVDGLPPVHAQTLDKLSKALEMAGIEFIGSPADSPGVRLKFKK